MQALVSGRNRITREVALRTRPAATASDPALIPRPVQRIRSATRSHHIFPGPQPTPSASRLSALPRSHQNPERRHPESDAASRLIRFGHWRKWGLWTFPDIIPQPEPLPVLSSNRISNECCVRQMGGMTATSDTSSRTSLSLLLLFLVSFPRNKTAGLFRHPEKMNRSQREERAVQDRRWAKNGSNSGGRCQRLSSSPAGSTRAASTTEPSGRFFTDFYIAHTTPWGFGPL